MRIALVLAVAAAIALGGSSEAAAAKPASPKAKGGPPKAAAPKPVGHATQMPAAAVNPPSPKRIATGAVERLGRGTRLVFAGDYAAAQQELSAVGDAPIYNRDTLLFFLATSESMIVPPAREAALGHFRELAAMQHSRWAKLAHAKIGDLLYELGRSAEAKAAYLDVLKNPSDEVEPAVARFRLAEIALQEGERSAAIDGYRKVHVDFPSHPLAEVALGRLRALAPGAATLITAKDRILRAQKLTGDHAWQRALDELSSINATLGNVGLLPASVRDEVDYWIGTVHFKMRHGYEIAAEKLLDVWSRLPADRQPEALFHGARACSRAEPGDDDKAIAGYQELLRRFPRSKQAAEASFLVGWLDFNRARYKEALPGLQLCLDKYGSSTFNDDARWYLGFARWMLGDAAGALGDFELLSQHSGALEGGKGRYWKGRALLKLGRKADAVATWRKLVGDYPLSWYASEARLRLREVGISIGPFGDAESKSPSSGIGPIDARVAEDLEVRRVDELLSAGLPVEAAAELDRVDRGLIARYGSPRAVPLLLDRYRKAEDFFHLHRLAEAHGNGALHRDPRSDSGARSWWQAIHPLAYQRHVEKYAPTGNNPPYYLYTIMQKESAYNPHDLSYADAIGLLQMIPPTSRRVAERIHRPYTDDVLYDPEGNVQFGAWYIGHLLEKFKGQIPLGAGSYNAGPKAMMRWINKNGDRRLDEFVELCSYTQTREYMKKASEIYARYVYLYAGEDYLPEEKIDTRYLDNEIDY